MSKSGKRYIAGLLILLTIFCATFAGCSESPDKYTVEEHIERISERIEERYFGEDTKFTGYSVYPLYNAEDKVEYFLVEFEPSGFAFVFMRETVPFAFGMYFRDDHYLHETWFRYRLCIDGQEPEPYEGKQWLDKKRNDGKHYSNEENYRYEVDDNEEIIKYNHSPYKIANVLEEKMYLLDINKGYVNAIKKDGKFINLISLEEIDYLGREWYYETMEYNYMYSHIPHLLIRFIIKLPL